jgi:hypothetical protein
MISHQSLSSLTTRSLTALTLALMAGTNVSVASAQCAQWVPGIGAPGTNGQVLAIETLPNGNVMVGGSFTQAGGVAANRIAMYSPSTNTWTSMGEGVNSFIDEILALPDGSVILGGGFTTAGGIAANRIVQLNPTSQTWTALSSGTDDRVLALARMSDGDIIAGGEFTSAGGQPANRIARFDVASRTWTPLGAGIGMPQTSHEVDAACVLPNGNIIAGGYFTTAGGLDANHIAMFNPTSGTWSALGTGTSSEVHALAVDSNGDVIVGGYYTRAGGLTVNNIARYRPSTSMWSALGSGVGSQVRAIAIPSNGDIVVAGFFTTAGGSGVNQVARFVPSSGQWLPLGTGLRSSPFGPQPFALAVIAGGDVVVGGTFNLSGNLSVGNISRYSFTGGAPLVTIQPSPVTTCTGGTAILTTAAATSSSTTNYRWRRNSLNLVDQAGRISGSATPQLTLTNVMTSNSGRYDCVITNGCGNTITQPAQGNVLSVCPNIIYVNVQAAPGGDGLSWASAYTDLQDALDAARRYLAAPRSLEIWVAQGAYQANRGQTTGSHSFELVSGVDIIGGFNGTETLVTQRDSLAHPTDLVGFGYTSRVLFASRLPALVELVGLTIRDGFYTESIGAGALIEYSTVHFIDCTIANNSIGYNMGSGGAGLYITDSSVQLHGCNITNNRGLEVGNNGYSGGFGASGGGIFCSNSILLLQDCSFAENRAGDGGSASCGGGFPTFAGDGGSGGALLAGGSTVTAINCVFVGNRSGGGGGGAYCQYGSSSGGQSGYGGAIANGGSVLNIINCTFASNSSSIDGSMAQTIVTNSIIWNNPLTPGATVTYSSLPTYVAGIGNVSGDPLFTDLDGPDQIAGTRDDDVSLRAGSPCNDAGNNTALPPGILTDLNNQPRFRDDPNASDNGLPGGSGGALIVDMGAYEGEYVYVPPIPCTGDYNNDGGIDGSDVEAFFVDWQSGNPNADIDGNGGVDGADVDAFFGFWVEGC